MSTQLLFPDESFKIRGACFNVYKEMGAGFLEAVYSECLKIEFFEAGIPFLNEPRLRLRYKDHLLNSFYSPDFVCFERIVVELKAVVQLQPEHRAQTFHYLKCSGCLLGFLVNFGHHPKIEIERIVATAGRFGPV